MSINPQLVALAAAGTTVAVPTKKIIYGNGRFVHSTEGETEVRVTRHGVWVGCTLVSYEALDEINRRVEGK